MVLSEADLSPIGYLSEAVFGILQTLLDDPDIELQIQCRASTTHGPVRKSISTSSSATLSVIIYGTFELFGDIGHLLELNDLFLQDPIGCDRVVEYRNPHRLSGLDLEPVMTSVDPTIATTTIEYAPHGEGFLQGFENGTSLPEAEPPWQLHTSLLKSAVSIQSRHFGS
jgi:hypothetical protein